MRELRRLVLRLVFPVRPMWESKQMTGAYYGRCDTCGTDMRDLGRVRVVSVRRSVVKFRFCSGACRRAFVDRDDITEEPPKPAVREVK